MTASRGNPAPRPRALAVAVASCAAAALSGSTSTSSQPASVQAVGQLGRHAAQDARGAVATAGRSPRRARRLLARSIRRLRYARTLAVLVQADGGAAWPQTAASLAHAASDVAGHAAALARQTRGRLEGRAVRAVGQAADVQAQLAFELASCRFPGSLAQLRQALQTAMDAQDQLLAALTGLAASARISPRRRRAARTAQPPAQQAREALAAGLIRIHVALSADADDRPTASDGMGADATPGRAGENPAAPHIDDPTSTSPATRRLDDFPC